MSGYKSVDDLELELSAGKGVAVIVEGGTYRDDPWFYEQWFGNLSRQVVFHPQGGWPQVVAAVRELRQRCPVPIYGIIDRDFCADYELDADFEISGILRTPRYTLENYLLDPICWASVFKLIARDPATASGWDDVQRVKVIIDDLYQKFLPVAAHNWVVKTITQKYFVETENVRKYLEDYQSFNQRAAVLNGLREWGVRISATEDLEQMFEERLNQLSRHSPESQISSKYVLKKLYELSPPILRRSALDAWESIYLNFCPTPPPDLVKLIDRIIIHAQQQRTQHNR